MYERIIPIGDNSLIKEIFGACDNKIEFIEKKLKVSVDVCSEGLVVKGKELEVNKAVDFLENIIRLAGKGITLSQEEMRNYLHSTKTKDNFAGGPLRIKVASKKRFVIPKTPGQIKYVNAIENYDITFAIGPAGTGKTYLAMAMAVKYFNEGKLSRIILTRPAIEAGESLGFLPGGMQEKLSPYLRPLYDALYDMMEPDAIEDNLETGIIEIAPLAYMRGRTLNNAFIILDEAQNCTSEQLKMFLTRLGFNSKTVITGDITQSDLPGGKPKGLIEAREILKSIKGIKFIHLNNRDVVRNPLIQKIVKAYENFYNKEQP